MFTQSMKSREGRFDLEKQAFFQGQQTKIVNQIFNFIYNNSSAVIITKCNCALGLLVSKLFLTEQSANFRNQYMSYKELKTGFGISLSQTVD